MKKAKANPNPKPTAAERFEFHLEESRSRLEELAVELKKMESEFARTGKTNWCFVGSVAHINVSLAELNEMFGK